MEQIKRYRYPGAKPFSALEKDFFFGRDNDVEKLLQLITIEKLVLFYGKSGMGKSSLINAGLIPRLETNGKYRIHTVRFGAYKSKEHNTTPLESTNEALGAANSEFLFLDKIKSNRNSLWFNAKLIQATQTPPKTLVLFFDQFEELFTYPEEEVADFKIQLSELLYTTIPQWFRDALENELNDSDSELTDDNLNLLNQQIDIKVIISIRSDHLSYLTRLDDYLPNILRTYFELRPLNLTQAEEAITAPARVEVIGVESNSYKYSEGVLKHIFDFLSKQNKHHIETFQLQLLMQYIETIVIEKNISLIRVNDIGDLHDIYQNYYDNQIKKLPSEKVIQKARELIEEGLIYEGEQIRLNLYEGQIITRYELDKEHLKILVDTHLLRKEQNQHGDFYYELSHDTLIPPILRSKEKRKEEEKVQTEKAVKEAELKRSNKKLRRNQFIATFAVLIVLILSFLTYEIYLQKSEVEVTVTNLEREKEKSKELLLELEEQKQLADEFREQMGVIYGIVNDIDKNPIPNIKIYVDSLPEISATTDSNGRFMIKIPADLRKMQHTIIAEGEGYKPYNSFIYPNLQDEIVSISLQINITEHARLSYEKATQLIKNGDERSAFDLYKEAANDGHITAYTQLGNMLLQGRGVDKNVAEAAKYFEKAAKAGDPEAQYSLGLLFFEGLGLTQNYRRAQEMFELSAVAGNVDAQFNLGKMLDKGYVEKNLLEAEKWYRKAAAQGHADAQLYLGTLLISLGGENNIKEAVDWYEVAAENNNPAAQYNLGVLYQYGKGVDMNVETAVYWFKKAAENGNRSAKTALEKLRIE